MVLKTKMPTSTHFKIVDDARLVGTMRVSPRKIFWNSAGRDVWLEIDMEALVAFMEANGTEVAEAEE
jgi:hypothetical protein